MGFNTVTRNVRQECPKCGNGEIKASTIENEETHHRKSCPECSWGYVKGG